jgi:hypothetical protein
MSCRCRGHIKKTAHILTKGDETKNNDYKKRKQKHAVVDRAHPVGVAVGGNQITLLGKRL